MFISLPLHWVRYWPAKLGWIDLSIPISSPEKVYICIVSVNTLCCSLVYLGAWSLVLNCCDNDGCRIILIPGMLHFYPCRLQWNQPFLRHGLQGNSMSYLRRSNISHTDLSVKRLPKCFVIREINRMIFAGGKGFYDPSSACDGLAANKLSPEVSHCILLLCKTGLRWFLHWRLTCNVNVRDRFILIFTCFWLTVQEISCDPFNANGIVRSSFRFNGSLTIIVCVFSSGFSAKNLGNSLILTPAIQLCIGHIKWLFNLGKWMALWYTNMMIIWYGPRYCGSLDSPSTRVPPRYIYRYFKIMNW